MEIYLFDKHMRQAKTGAAQAANTNPNHFVLSMRECLDYLSQQARQERFYFLEYLLSLAIGSLHENQRFPEFRQKKLSYVEKEGKSARKIKARKKPK